MRFLNVDNFPIGFISDIHNNIESIKKVRNKHPEIKQWFCLGDIIDFIHPARNNETLDWFRQQDIITILGNHEWASMANKTVNKDHREWLEQQGFLFQVNLPNMRSLLLCHNKSNDLWGHVDHINEEELIKWYPIIGHNIRAVLIGHNHKQFHFVPNSSYIDTELWSIGSLGENGQYVIMDENYNFKFCKL